MTPEDRACLGREARDQVPPEAHAELVRAAGRDPVQVLVAEDASRLPDLVPLRHARMLASPFAFFRGAAGVMAADLARTPKSGLTVQLCGDAHLSNFGMFASPERNLLFDINDFDETIPGPWEWDVKRLSASLVIAAHDNGFTPRQARKIALAAVRRYQASMAELAALGNLEVWYTKLDVAEARRQIGDQIDARTGKRLDRAIAKARSRDHRRSLQKLTAIVDGRRRIVGDPPLVVPISDLAPETAPDAIESAVGDLLERYSQTLPVGFRELVRSYRFVDMARKVVGVGSVGTRCWIVLMVGRDEDDPLFLQVKEAGRSALADHLGDTSSIPHGERVVTGQRLMQAAGDPFLGYQTTIGLDGRSRDFYVRQLADWKGSADVATMLPRMLRSYGQLCAWSLARAHARSGDRIAIAAYLGTDDVFAQAVTAFAEGYAELNSLDHAAMRAAVEAGLVRSQG
ncbi:DUF2252 domain-containing protein [Nocardioides mesophilus]|uniref:DUF2252 domain-containing protein n=1 Tax=Nocardioides mesophilus TaxID=433659 RepID=UPI001CB716F8|nr:DUF2252 domain-containing protein [Nocardioides mesophilus]